MIKVFPDGRIEYVKQETVKKEKNKGYTTSKLSNWIRN